MIPRCPWCLNAHRLSTCPAVPKSPTQVRDSLSERMMLYRATKNALLGYAKQNGFAFPDAIRALDPDFTT